MNPINNLINPNQQQILRRPFQHGQIIPNANRNQRRLRLIAPNPINQIELTRQVGNLLTEPIAHNRPSCRRLPIDRFVKRHMIRRHNRKIAHTRQTRAGQTHRPIIIADLSKQRSRFTIRRRLDLPNSPPASNPIANDFPRPIHHLRRNPILHRPLPRDNRISHPITPRPRIQLRQKFRPRPKIIRRLANPFRDHPRRTPIRIVPPLPRVHGELQQKRIRRPSRSPVRRRDHNKTIHTPSIFRPLHILPSNQSSHALRNQINPHRRIPLAQQSHLTGKNRRRLIQRPLRAIRKISRLKSRTIQEIGQITATSVIPVKPMNKNHQRPMCINHAWQMHSQSQILPSHRLRRRHISKSRQRIARLIPIPRQLLRVKSNHQIPIRNRSVESIPKRTIQAAHNHPVIDALQINPDIPQGQ